MKPGSGMSESLEFSMGDWPTGKVGYVALLGRPNTGKSTFLNTVLDVHLAAVSAKPQTTRRRCLGVHTDDGSQVLFLDAPGVHAPKHELDAAMCRAIARALEDADLVLCIADAARAPGEEDRTVAEHAAASGKPAILAINKTDVSTEEQVAAMRDFYGGFLPDAPAYPVAAIRPETLEPLMAALKDALPHGPFLYPPDTLTDVAERWVGAELIREALLENLRQEVPHAMAVTIDSWKESDRGRRIEATLHVEREPQKRIVVGRGGRMIQRLRDAAARKLEGLCGVPVTLRLWVKVDPDWRRKKAKLRDFELLG